MAQLAIEIGFDKIRACVAIGRDIHKVPLGAMSSPYEYPPIAVKSHNGYIFGKVAKVCAVTSPDSTVFLYDYLRRNTVPKDAIIALLNTIQERVAQLYNVDIDSIALVTPPFFKDILQSRFLDNCISSVSDRINVNNFAISFSQSYLNVRIGQRVLFLDFRDNPAHASVILRGTKSYDSIGASTIEDFSTTDCENFVEDKILSNYAIELFPDEEIITAWIQGDIASKISQDAIQQLLLGKNVSYEIPFTVGTISISQSEFQNWLLPKLDKICDRIIGYVREIGLTLLDISQIVVFGGVFESRLVRDRIERFLSGYNQDIKLSYFSAPMDEWKICESILKMNFNGFYALAL